MPPEPLSEHPTSLLLAEKLRDACVAAAKQAYEEAGISGLCAEGRWENALGAIETLDLKKIIIEEK